MAKAPNADTSPVGAKPPAGGGPIARFFKRLGAPDVTDAGQGHGSIVPTQPLTVNNEPWESWTADPVSLAFLAGTANRPARSRQQIYQIWQDMMADPVIVSALRLHVTAALGGHETKGEMVFLEPTADAKKDKALEKLVLELSADLQPLLNKIAPTVCFNAAGFGDAYARIYGAKGIGVRDLLVDELMLTPLIQPYERGNTTIGYEVATGSNYSARLSVLQVARMKMPRQLYLPQNRVIEKSVRVSLKEDDIDKLPPMPGLAGGSFLDGAEIPYAKFTASWAGLTGQRIRDSISQSIVTVQQEGTTVRQRKEFQASIQAMIAKSNAYIADVVSRGRTVFGDIMHFMPVNSEKQLTQIQGAVGAGRATSLTIDDVMMNARFLAGALGMDLSMLGFADQMGGGLGEGGFFRLSAQAAERSRSIRAALTEFIDHVISVHLLLKTGKDYHGIDKPWQVTYYSGISALESERAKTKADAMNSGALLVQTLTQLREIGWSAEAMQHLLEKEFAMDADDAKMYSQAIKAAPPPVDPAGGGAFGGGGGGDFGGGPAGGSADDAEDPPVPAPSARMPMFKPKAEAP